LLLHTNFEHCINLLSCQTFYFSIRSVIYLSNASINQFISLYVPVLSLVVVVGGGGVMATALLRHLVVRMRGGHGRVHGVASVRIKGENRLKKR
jgi:ABC-type transporter Mla maintaining outer membrane lipid asymmetry ATPase subunit MlaF